MYVTLRGRWCDIVLSVHAPVNKSDGTKDNLYEELERVFSIPEVPREISV
jgi:hypothetical protein